MTIKPKNRLHVFAKTDVGRERTHNEDNFIVSPDLSKGSWMYDGSLEYEVDDKGTLLVVADGMGGTNAGEVASRIAIQSIQNYFKNSLAQVNTSEPNHVKSFLVSAIQFANTSIINHAIQDPKTTGMGTTIVIGWIIHNQLYTAWVGDSRAYIFNSDDGLKAITEDHSLVQELVSQGQITEEQAFFHPQKNVITQSLGDSTTPIKPSVEITTLEKDDMVLLCSDGLNSMIQDEEIKTRLNLASGSVSSAAQLLIEAANTAGGHDNITIAVASIVKTRSTGLLMSRDIMNRKMILLISGSVALLLSLLLVFNILVLSRDVTMKEEFSDSDEQKLVFDSSENKEIKDSPTEIVSPQKKSTKSNVKIKDEPIPESNQDKPTNTEKNNSGSAAFGNSVTNKFKNSNEELDQEVVDEKMRAVKKFSQRLYTKIDAHSASHSAKRKALVKLINDIRSSSDREFLCQKERSIENYVNDDEEDFFAVDEDEKRIEKEILRDLSKSIKDLCSKGNNAAFNQ